MERNVVAPAMTSVLTSVPCYLSLNSFSMLNNSPFILHNEIKLHSILYTLMDKSPRFCSVICRKFLLNGGNSGNLKVKERTKKCEHVYKVHFMIDRS